MAFDIDIDIPELKKLFQNYVDNVPFGEERDEYYKTCRERAKNVLDDALSFLTKMTVEHKELVKEYDIVSNEFDKAKRELKLKNTLT